MKKCAGICLKFIAAVGAIIFLFLTFYSWRYTMQISIYSEELTDMHDTMWRSVLLLLLAVEIVFRLETWEKYLTDKRVHVLAVLVSVAVMFVGFRLVHDAHSMTGTDQLHMYLVAEDIAEGTGERFASGYEYFYCYPNQLGLAGIYAFFLNVWGHSQDVLRYIHAVLAGVTVYMGFLITGQLSGDRRAEILYLLGISGFLPLYLYVLFVYGEPMGVCAMLCGIWAFLKAQKETGTKRYGYWALLAFAMIVMYAARQGLIIVWIALFLIRFLMSMQDGKKIPLLLMAGVLLLTLGGQKMLIRLSEYRMNADFGAGAPAVSWIAMGMQTHENEALPPGYYNGYQLQVFREANRDTARAAALSEDYIRERLADWRQHPEEMIRFYKGKILGQWNEPTYNAFTMTNLMEDPAEWVSELYWGDTRRDWSLYLNAFQAVVYLMVLGNFCGLLFRGFSSEKRKPEEYLLGLILLGGFFFSIIWETKSRYIYPYSVVMIPCAAMSLVYYYDRLPKMTQMIWAARGKQGKNE